MHPRLQTSYPFRMAVYLFTYHAYRSWMPDNPLGYVRRGEGILPPDAIMAQHYTKAARADEVAFDHTMQRVIVHAVRESCAHHAWRLHYACTTSTHAHILISWRGFFDWKRVSNTLKRRIGIALSKAFNRKGPWLSRGQSAKRVKDQAHFDHLMTTYLPNHRGASWREDLDAHDD